MKTLIISIFYLSLFIYQGYPQQPNFFPISIGNEYQIYDGYGYQFGVIERDTIYPNGKTYFHLPSPFDFLDCRVDSSGNILSISRPFFGGGPEEHLLYKADAILDEIWVISDSINPLNMKGYGKCIYTDSGYIFGKTRFIKGVLIFDESYYYYYFWLAEGIGLVREQYDDGSTSVLNYAKIDGKIYGNLVSVVKETPSILNQFNVSQNYPNPFNGITNIDLNLPTQFTGETIKLSVYNVLGLKVYENNYSVTSSLTISFNTDQLNLSSGAYFYSVTYGTKSIIKKFLLLK
jgi:hypothetical protein